MKHEISNNTDIVLQIIQAELKENGVLRNAYLFEIKDRRVKVVFSDNAKTPTIENALVKIATRRIV